MTNHPFCCHIAVTPSLHFIEQNLLSHNCHTTITEAIPSLKKSTPPKEIWLISSQKSHIFSKMSHVFAKISLDFLKTPLDFSKRSHIIEEKTQFTGQPCDRCDRKKHKTPGIYARVRPCSVSRAAQLRPSREGSYGCIHIKLGRNDIPTTNSERHKKKSKRRCASQQTRWGA